MPNSSRTCYASRAALNTALLARFHRGKDRPGPWGQKRENSTASAGIAASAAGQSRATMLLSRERMRAENLTAT